MDGKVKQLEGTVAALRHENRELRALQVGGGDEARAQCAAEIAAEIGELQAGMQRTLALLQKWMGAPEASRGRAPSRFTKSIKVMQREGADSRSYEQLFELRRLLGEMLDMSNVSVARAFRLFDTNHDGALDQAELTAAFAELGISIEARTLDDIVALLDNDGDGTVDLDEFAAWFGQGPPPAPLTPEVRLRMQAREDAHSWMTDQKQHLGAIKTEVLGRRLRSKTRDRATQQRQQQQRQQPPAHDKPKAVRDFENAMRNISTDAPRLRRRADVEDRSAPRLEKPEEPHPLEERREDQRRLQQMITLFPEAVEYLNKVDTADRSAPIIEEGVRVQRHQRPQHLSEARLRVRQQSIGHNMRIKKEMQARMPPSKDAERAFRDFDENGDGTLDLEELAHGLRRLGVSVEDSDVERMFHALDRDGDGCIGYVEFVQWFTAGPPPPPPMPETMQRAVQAAAARGAMTDALRSEIEQSSVNMMHKLYVSSIQGGATLRETGGVHRDASGAVFHAEETYDIGSGGSSEILQEVRSMVQYFPELLSGYLKKTESSDRSAPQLAGLKAPSVLQGRQSRKGLLGDVAAAAEKRSYEKLLSLRAMLRPKFSEAGVTGEQAFRAFDRNGDGILQRHELEDALSQLCTEGGFELEKGTADDVFAMLDKDGSGFIDFVEFTAWFGSGAPPVPVSAEVKERIKSSVRAREASSTWVAEPDQHLKAIKKAWMNRKLRQKQGGGRVDMRGGQNKMVAAAQRFAQLDKDHTGKLQGQELLDLASWVIEQLPQEGRAAMSAAERGAMVGTIMKRTDKDGDGSMDFSEFSAWFARTMSLAKAQAARRGKSAAPAATAPRAASRATSRTPQAARPAAVTTQDRLSALTSSQRRTPPAAAVRTQSGDRYQRAIQAIESALQVDPHNSSLQQKLRALKERAGR